MNSNTLHAISTVVNSSAVSPSNINIFRSLSTPEALLNLLTSSAHLMLLRSPGRTYITSRYKYHVGPAGHVWVMAKTSVPKRTGKSESYGLRIYHIRRENTSTLPSFSLFPCFDKTFFSSDVHLEPDETYTSFV